MERRGCWIGWIVAASRSGCWRKELTHRGSVWASHKGLVEGDATVHPVELMDELLSGLLSLTVRAAPDPRERCPCGVWTLVGATRAAHQFLAAWGTLSMSIGVRSSPTSRFFNPGRSDLDQGLLSVLRRLPAVPDPKRRRHRPRGWIECADWNAPSSMSPEDGADAPYRPAGSPPGGHGPRHKYGPRPTSGGRASLSARATP